MSNGKGCLKKIFGNSECFSSVIPRSLLRGASYAEFSDYRSFKTHDLDVLLHLSGIEDKVKATLLAEWSAIAQWSPESRYSLIGKATRSDACLMVTSTKVLLGKV